MRDVERATDDELARRLCIAVMWLREAWFAPWLEVDRGDLDLAEALRASADPSLADRLGDDQLARRLDELAGVVEQIAGWVTATDPASTTLEQWRVVQRPAIARVVDLYESACRRNADVLERCARLGFKCEPPGLLLTETVEEAITELYDGLAAAAGRLERRLRGRGVEVEDPARLLNWELAYSRSDDQRFEEAAARAWGRHG